MTDILPETTLREMVRAGVHVGHRKSRRHPRMMPFIYGIRGNTEIIDVSKIDAALGQAADFLRDVAARGGTILFVGTRASTATLVRDAAQDLEMPYVATRWIGGTMTNFAVVGKRLEAFRALGEREASGELAEKYTKAERLRFQRQLARFEEEIGGIRNLRKLPDALVLVSLRADQLAAREARKRRIPAVAIVDTDTDPSFVDYPIPGNDDAIPSVRYILNRLAAAIRQGKMAGSAKRGDDGEKSGNGVKGGNGGSGEE